MDIIIEKLLSVRGCKPGKTVDITEKEVNLLCSMILPILKE